MRSVFADHFPAMVLLAALVSAFLALLWRESPREAWRFFRRTFLLLVGGAIAAGWLLLLLPGR